MPVRRRTCGCGRSRAARAARLALGQYTGVYSIWKFAKNRRAAERFLADLCIDSREAIVASGLFNVPELPRRVPRRPIIYKAAAADPHPPKGKYSILTTVALEAHPQRGLPGPPRTPLSPRS